MEVIIKRWVDNDWDPLIQAFGNKKYEVRQYPAGTPGGEYQKWCKGVPVCECRSDGRDLENFTYAEKKKVQTATATFEDIFEDIRVLADMLRDTTQKEAIHRDINEEKKRFLSVYSEQDGRDALTGLVTFVERIQMLIPPADKQTSKLATFLISFCEQMKGIFYSVKPYGLSYTAQINSRLEKYYSTVPLALLLAKLKRLGQW
jgi:hypothetical protein